MRVLDNILQFILVTLNLLLLSVVEIHGHLVALDLVNQFKGLVLDFDSLLGFIGVEGLPVADHLVEDLIELKNVDEGLIFLDMLVDGLKEVEDGVHFSATQTRYQEESPFFQQRLYLGEVMLSVGHYVDNQRGDDEVILLLTVHLQDVLLENVYLRPFSLSDSHLGLVHHFRRYVKHVHLLNLSSVLVQGLFQETPRGSSDFQTHKVRPVLQLVSE